MIISLIVVTWLFGSGRYYKEKFDANHSRRLKGQTRRCHSQFFQPWRISKGNIFLELLQTIHSASTTTECWPLFYPKYLLNPFFFWILFNVLCLPSLFIFCFQTVALLRSVPDPPPPSVQNSHLWYKLRAVLQGFSALRGSV